MKEFVKLIATEHNKENNLEISTGYEIGGTNYYNNNSNTRGYYLYCTPVEVRDNDYKGRTYKTYTNVLGKGAKILLKPVTRRSKKAEAEAEEKAKEYREKIIGYVTDRYGLIIDK